MVDSGISLGSKARDVVGGKTADELERAFGIVTIRDLLMHLPRRYVFRGELSLIADLRDDEEATVVARVVSVKSRRFTSRSGRRMDMVDIVVTDDIDTMSLTFFNQPYRAKQLHVGQRALFGGKVGTYKNMRQLVNPDCLLFEAGDEVGAIDNYSAVIPIYPATAKLKSWSISKSIRVALRSIDWNVEPESLPADVRSRHGLPTLRQAFDQVHNPESSDMISAGKLRLRWDEAFAMQAALAMKREALSHESAAPRHRILGGLVDQLDTRLPFELTDGQKSVSETIFEELGNPSPMHRLLQGDVGSGKTVVALRAMLATVDSGGQAAMLAPTEVLAAQHYRSICELLGPLGQRGMLTGSDDATDVVLLTGSMSTAERKDALLKIFTGEAGIVVGTHALLEDRVVFNDLGLVVVDEQHRFGVEQRAALADKAAAGMRPHVLVMTATPIPRTVAITVFGDLDLSTLTELPKGRAPIETFVVPTLDKPRSYARVWERVREEVEKGHQVYIVCPRIGAGDPIDSDYEFNDETDEFEEPDEAGTVSRRRKPPKAIPMTSVEEVVPMLEAGPLKGLAIATLHGQMHPDEKDEVMRRFAQGAEAKDPVEVLVATTVIEVGVDVANATVMVIMDADRFGISQLHQLRGRVGRGGLHGLCLLVTNTQADSPARDRLDAVAGTTDGFELSIVDLRARKEGDVLGGTQSGRRSSLRVLSVFRDGEIISRARAEASDVVSADPKLLKAEHRALRRAVDELIGPEGADWLTRS